MTEKPDNSGQSDLAPGLGSSRNLVSREEFNKVVSQRDRTKDELRTLRNLYEESEQANHMLHSKLEKELENKNLSEQKKQELASKLKEVESKYFSEKDLLEQKLNETQGKLEETENTVTNFHREKMVVQQENAFLQAAKQASYSHESAEILLGYLRGQNRLRSVPIYDDEAKQVIREYQHEVECYVPREDGFGFENQVLTLDKAMPYLKKEKKSLAPAVASGGYGSKGSDGPVRPGVLNRKNMTLEQYKASRDTMTGEVMIQ